MVGLVLPPLRLRLLRPRTGLLIVLWPLLVLLLVVLVVVMSAALVPLVLLVLPVVPRVVRVVVGMGVGVMVLLVWGPRGRESARAVRLRQQWRLTQARKPANRRTVTPPGVSEAAERVPSPKRTAQAAGKARSAGQAQQQEEKERHPRRRRRGQHGETKGRLQAKTPDLPQRPRAPMPLPTMLWPVSQVAVCRFQARRYPRTTGTVTGM